MEASTNYPVFIVHDMHIAENLEHHKASDVKRILEDKGFETVAQDGSSQHYKIAGNPDTGKQTQIYFDKQGFVKQEGGVKHL